MRVVLDTNILISGLLTLASPPRTLLIAWRSGKFRLLTCERQFDEFRRVTRLEKLRERLRPHEAGRLVNEMRTYAEFRADLPFVDLSADPDDNYLLALAKVGGADFVVTGDKADLLSLQRFGTTRIVTARQLLDSL